MSFDRFRLSTRTQERAVRGMQLLLLGLVFVGIERGDAGVIVNASVSLLVTYLPGVLERDYGLPMNTGLTLWVTTAVFLHAVGTGGVPGVDVNLYQTFWWWDHVTHALSSSVVAAVGYTVVRALDEHADTITIPDRVTVVFVLVFVLAFGVVWEVIEFGLGGLASMTGSESVLIQFGLDDTMADLFFDLLGGLVAGIWGTAYLTDLVTGLGDRLGGREG